MLPRVTVHCSAVKDPAHQTRGQLRIPVVKIIRLHVYSLLVITHLDTLSLCVLPPKRVLSRMPLQEGSSVFKCCFLGIRHGNHQANQNSTATRMISIFPRTATARKCILLHKNIPFPSTSFSIRLKVSGMHDIFLVRHFLSD